MPLRMLIGLIGIKVYVWQLCIYDIMEMSIKNEQGKNPPLKSLFACLTADREDMRSRKHINTIKGSKKLMKDFYEILGIAKDATQEEIKKKYRKLSKEHHPDKGGDGKLFAEITEAYQVLSDPDKRAAYDRGEYVSNERNPEELARMRLAALFDSAISGTYFEEAKRRDIITDLKAALKKTKKTAERDVKALRDRIKVLGEISKRLSGKDDLLNQVVDNNKRSVHRAIEGTKAEIEQLKLLIELCDDYKYNTTSEFTGGIAGFLAEPSPDLLDMLKDKD
jgi:curved DNA-binding protein CbpA